MKLGQMQIVTSKYLGTNLLTFTESFNIEMLEELAVVLHFITMKHWKMVYKLYELIMKLYYG